MTITVTLPDTYPLSTSQSNIADEIRLHHAQMLYAQGRISLGKAAELANFDIQEFMRLCAQANLPSLDYNPNDLAAEQRFIAASTI